jgi:L-asparaginase / beta-aspartyl-peptidase
MFVRTCAAINTSAAVRLLHASLTEAADDKYTNRFAAASGDGALIVLMQRPIMCFASIEP